MTKRARKKSPPKETKAQADSPTTEIATGSSNESFFWPELAAGREAEAIAAGRGAAYKRFADARLELRAVNERWPIPTALRERMIFENARVILDPNVPNRERQMAQRLLIAMDQINTRPRDLPVQVETASITINQILSVIGEKSQDLDLRDVKVIPGSVDDYAE